MLRPAQVSVEPRVLSFDIETDPKGEKLLAVSMFAPDVDEVLIVDGSERPMREGDPLRQRARRGWRHSASACVRSIRT
ncbi:MAG: hypothetical protein WDO68_19550 [Gammaproteobacteria bacterium]